MFQCFLFVKCNNMMPRFRNPFLDMYMFISSLICTNIFLNSCPMNMLEYLLSPSGIMCVCVCVCIVLNFNSKKIIRKGNP